MRQEGRCSTSGSLPVHGVFRERLSGGLAHCLAVVTGTGATQSSGMCSPRPACWALPEACCRWREESSGSRRCIVMAALLAQERLTVFCIYLLIFLLFLKKECSCGHLVSLSGMCVHQTVSLHPLPWQWSAANLGPPPSSYLPAVGLTRIGGLLVALL